MKYTAFVPTFVIDTNVCYCIQMVRENPSWWYVPRKPLRERLKAAA